MQRFQKKSNHRDQYFCCFFKKSSIMLQKYFACWLDIYRFSRVTTISQLLGTIQFPSLTGLMFPGIIQIPNRVYSFQPNLRTYSNDQSSFECKCYNVWPFMATVSQGFYCSLAAQSQQKSLKLVQTRPLVAFFASRCQSDGILCSLQKCFIGS